jgi:hypothetical protein
MRIPWYIYTPLCLIVTLLTLYFFTKDKDLVSPPGQEVIDESISQWREDNPSIRNTKLSDIPTEPAKPEPTIEPKLKPEPQTPVEPEPEPIVEIPSISPALNFLVQENFTSAQLIALAEHLQSKGELQLARIAYERVIDCASDASEDDRTLAATAISKLISETLLWNPDPSLRKKFTINIQVNNAYLSYAKTLIPKLEEVVFDASDGMLSPSIKLTSTDAPLSSLNIGDEDSAVRFTIKNQTVVSLKIHAALYNAIRNTNNESQKLTSIPPLPEHISPQQAVQTFITRLAWVNAAN